MYLLQEGGANAVSSEQSKYQYFSYWLQGIKKDQIKGL